MDPVKIIDRLGGTSEVAKLCQCSPQAVSQWFGPDPDTGVQRTIPKARLMYLQAVKPDVFAALAAEEERAGRKNRAPSEPSLSRPTASSKPAKPRNRDRSNGHREAK